MSPNPELSKSESRVGRKVAVLLSMLLLDGADPLALDKTGGLIFIEPLSSTPDAAPERAKTAPVAFFGL